MSPYRSADRDLTGPAASPNFASERNLYKPRPVVLDSCTQIFSAIVVTQHFCLEQLEMNTLNCWNDWQFKVFAAQRLGSDFLQDKIVPCIYYATLALRFNGQE
ncbi:uncharacterized protein EAE97_000467 [Botrytis byssoidea]|uniref:Uncharacterized protein n=1 Tax=Botrytis byssoidea TaxID=139641 RepID=A0A9P5J0A2_9HELO|nr:uncharacterized protein EAE97_000467 [Botrytis byssoidea]KAF7955208.1 hypothetical protein EAE97_000467 [Botrytis byssoidea]